MPRVLDIDLDIFVTPVSNMHRDNRVTDDSCETWSELAVRHYLEDVCGLRQDQPKPGLLFEEHDELFDGIARALAAGLLEAPFDLVHVDAHADLGAGQFLPIKYLLTELMPGPADRRENPVRGERGLNRGTVILFVAARGWLGSLTYLHHPDDGEDLLPVFLACDDGGQFHLQLPRCSTARLEDWARRHGDAMELRESCEYPAEITVPLDVVPIGEATPADYDFVTLTRSPGFTPPKADALFDLIAGYIHPVF